MGKSVYQILLELKGDQEVQGALRGIGTQLGLTGAAMTAFGVGAAKMAADYETALANVATVSDETTGSTEEFGQALYGLQADMEGAINVQEAAVASYDILSAGIKDQEAVLQALESSQKAAIAGQSDLNAVSKAAVSVVNSYGDALGEGLTQAEKFDKVVNLMLQTQLDGVITADEYAASIGAVAAGFQVAGLSIEETNGLIAVTTAKGIPAAQAFTNLKAALANIQQPTAAAAEEAKRLGIEFDATRLQSVGLQQILVDIAETGKAEADTLANLFGSTEARSSIALLMDNLDDLDGSIQNQINGMGALDEAYELTSQTINQRVTNSINQLQGAMIQLGQGVIIAAEPFINMLADVVNWISQLDPQLLKIVGTIVIVGGAVATLSGAFALYLTVAGSTTTMVTTLSKVLMGQLIPALTTSATATNLYAAATAKLSLGGIVAAIGAKVAALKAVPLAMPAVLASMKAMAIGLKAMLVAAGPVVIALGAIAVGFNKLQEHKANQKIEQTANELEALRQATQPLVSELGAVVMKMNETGEALPEHEFQQWIQQLEAADQGSGVLEHQIGALTRVQERLTGVTEDSADANEELASSTDEVAQSAEEAAKNYGEYASRVANSVSVLQSQADIAKEALVGTETEIAQERLAIQEKSTADQINLLEDLKNQSQTSAEDRIAIEIDIAERKIRLNEERLKTQKEIDEAYNQFLRDTNKEWNTDYERLVLEQNKTFEEAYEKRYAIIETQYGIERDLLEDSLKDLDANSAEAQAIRTKLSELNLSELQKVRELEKQVLDERIAGIQRASEAQRSFIELQSQGLDLQSESNRIGMEYATGYSSLLNDISGLLKDENTTLSQQNQLLELAEELTGQRFTTVGDISAVEQAQKVIQEELAQLEITKLDLKIKQLEIDREQLKIAGEIRQLEIQSEQSQIAAQLEGNLTQPERQQLQTRSNVLGQQAELERRRTDIGVQGIDNQIGLASFERAIAQIMNPNGGEVSDREPLLSPAEYDEGVERQSRVTRETGQEQQREIQQNRQSTDVVSEQVRSGNQEAQNLGNTSLQSLQEIERNTRDFTNITGSITELAQINNSILRTNQGISEKVDYVNRQLQDLPRAIAASMPRPQPAPVPRS